MRTFRNPVLPYGPDPYVCQHGGLYYQMATAHDRLELRCTPDLTRLAEAAPRVLWRAPAEGPCARDVWAPELHRLGGRWYVYFTANHHDGDDAKRRLYVLGCDGNDPMTGTWRHLGPLGLVSDRYSIDATVLSWHGSDYLVWSPKLTIPALAPFRPAGFWQHIMIARLAEPTRLAAPEVVLSLPDQAWECDLQPTNEGPQILTHGEDVFIAYSCSAFWSDNYALGWLRLRRGGDPLDATAWSKSPGPAFSQDPAAGVFGPGHNSFFRSPDGCEDWICYHARPQAGSPDPDTRAPHLQRFAWKADGTPDFGRPWSTAQAHPLPSGTRD